MNRDDLLERLAAANPVPNEVLRGLSMGPAARELFDRAVESDLEPDTQVVRSRRAVPRRVVTAALIAAVALIATQLLPGGSRSGASAAELLRRTARVAGSRTLPTPMPFAYVHFVTAERFTSVSDLGPWSAILPIEEEHWVTADGSGRVVSRTGAPTFLGLRDEARYEASGAPPLGGKQDDHTFGPGGLGLDDTSGLPTDPDQLAAVIRDRAGTSGRADASRMLTMVGELLSQGNASPELRAALYRVAAGIDGVELVGAVTDPEGREGMAVAVSSDDQGAPIRTTMIFDPTTSQLLAIETVLLARVPWIDEEPGAVIGYTAYLQSGTVNSVTRRPTTP